MVGARNGSLTRVRRVLLALVAVLPLLLRGHVHGATEAVAHPCAICVVAHHSPTSAPAPVEIRATVEISHAVRTSEAPRIARRGPAIRSVRAPPQGEPHTFV